MKLEIQGIAKKFRGKQVLRSVTLTAESGCCIGILGANGSGKSTLLSILAGVQQRSGGSFLCDGKDLFSQPALRARIVGYVPQGTPLLEDLTALDNLRLWYGKAALRQELESGVLAALGIGEFLHKQVSKLSGGMKKRLSIGCAVAKRPPVLLLDEPAAALDLKAKNEIARYLQQYKKAGGILLLTTHDVQELALCDRWYILKDGVLEEFRFDGDLDALVDRL